MKATKQGFSIIFFAIVIFMMPCLTHAHSVKGTVDKGGIAVTAKYNSGEAMSYARVKISAPGTGLTFQSGRTDRNGRFCFFPDGAGDWKVIVDDEMGHRLEVMVPVDETLTLQANQQREVADEISLSRYERALMGISIIFGIFGTILGWKGYKNRKPDIEDIASGKVKK
jgi:nickel transport protein